MWRDIQLVGMWGVLFVLANGCASQHIQSKASAIPAQTHPDTHFVPPADVSELSAAKEIVARREPDAIYRGEQLKWVLDYLGERCNVTVIVHWDELARSQVLKDRPVSIDLKNRTFGEAMAEVLEQVGDPHSPLGYTIEDGTVTVRPMKCLTEPGLASAAPDITAHGEPFNDILDRLREASQAQIFVNWKALEQIHVRRDLPVTLEWKNLTIAEALKTLLNEVGSQRAQIGYETEEGVIVISTTDDLARNVMTRVYDIRAGIRGDHRQEDIATIIRNVEGIQPLTWKDNGGTCGACREISGQLIVTQTPAVQRLVAREIVSIGSSSSQAFPLINTPRVASAAAERNAQP